MLYGSEAVCTDDEVEGFAASASAAAELSFVEPSTGARRGKGSRAKATVSASGSGGKGALGLLLWPDALLWLMVPHQSSASGSSPDRQEEGTSDGSETETTGKRE